MSHFKIDHYTCKLVTSKWINSKMRSHRKRCHLVIDHFKKCVTSIAGHFEKCITTKKWSFRKKVTFEMSHNDNNYYNRSLWKMNHFEIEVSAKLIISQKCVTLIVGHVDKWTTSKKNSLRKRIFKRMGHFKKWITSKKGLFEIDHFEKCVTTIMVHFEKVSVRYL